MLTFLELLKQDWILFYFTTTTTNKKTLHVVLKKIQIFLHGAAAYSTLAISP